MYCPSVVIIKLQKETQTTWENYFINIYMKTQLNLFLSSRSGYKLVVIKEKVESIK